MCVEEVCVSVCLSSWLAIPSLCFLLPLLCSLSFSSLLSSPLSPRSLFPLWFSPPPSPPVPSPPSGSPLLFPHFLLPQEREKLISTVQHRVDLLKKEQKKRDTLNAKIQVLLPSFYTCMILPDYFTSLFLHSLNLPFPPSLLPSLPPSLPPLPSSLLSSPSRQWRASY